MCGTNISYFSISSGSSTELISCLNTHLSGRARTVPTANSEQPSSAASVAENTALSESLRCDRQNAFTSILQRPEIRLAAQRIEGCISACAYDMLIDYSLFREPPRVLCFRPVYQTYQLVFRSQGKQSRTRHEQTSPSGESLADLLEALFSVGHGAGAVGEEP